MKIKPNLYRINYINQNQVYELYAKQIVTDSLLGFMSISGILFDLSEGVVIDPIEEQLKHEFKDVEVLHIPLAHVLKVEEVKHKKSCKIKPLKPNAVVTPLSNQPGPQQ
ncbi:DUF1820 family protein [Marinicella litoralis]|uniref:DUF1820 family protein n=1 Tax=Marinicella litoralis TaxID=644220 RepID=A0A4R6XVR3_9GAMM|nr:DUF1820 family protein [Marinicella litoralis]TDR20558.1 hypothetical protein C8D91_1532 [Marinicella litoralis]